MRNSMTTEGIRDAKQQLHTAAGRTAEELRDQTQRGLEYLEGRAEDAKGRARELSTQAETLVKSRPWLAMGAAALVGLALARLLR